MKWIDIPPVWLLLFAVIAWLSRSWVTAPLSGGLGTSLVTAGLVLMAAAIFEMQRKRTTPIPHMPPSALVSSGIFGLTRNPIYLGDALVLAGLGLRWDAPVALFLVPVFMWVIHTRFITAEEARLTAAFPQAFPDYAARVRRWI